MNCESKSEVLNAYLDGMERRGELLPGARLAVLQAVGDRHLDAPAALRALVEHLDGEGAVLLNPERPKSRPAEPPLRAILRRLPLAEGAAETLYDKWAVEMAGADPGGIASGVLRRLARDDCRLFHRQPPPAVQGTAVPVRAVLGELHRAGYLRDGLDLDKLASQWADLGRGNAQHIAAVVARRLQDPGRADLAPADGPREINWQSPLFAPAAPSAPARPLPAGGI